MTLPKWFVWFAIVAFGFSIAVIVAFCVVVIVEAIER